MAIDMITAHDTWLKIKVIKRRACGCRDQAYFFLKIRAAFPGNSDEFFNLTPFGAACGCSALRLSHKGRGAQKKIAILDIRNASTEIGDEPFLAPLPLWERGWGEGEIMAGNMFSALDPKRN